jgi:heme-degrading monooxygenase HmoA
VGTVFVRVWEYDVPAGRESAFLAAYGAGGDWERLFRRARGYAGTELYRDTAHSAHYITVDRWREESDWSAFLAEWRADYEALDARLQSLTAADRRLVEGSV